MQQQRLFIIPNNDAEAVAIQKLLERNGERFLVTGQEWGASWENLEPKIMSQIAKTKDRVFGIELKGTPPDKCANLDNHTYYTGGEISQERRTISSSIRQVAALLDKDLTLEEQFIEANDSGYIPRMYQLGEELGMDKSDIEDMIKRVNEFEEEAQGISPELKEVAKSAIEDAYIYDERFIWIDLTDFRAMRTVTNELYKMSHYKDPTYETIVIDTHDCGGRIIVFGNRTKVLNKLVALYRDNSWSGGAEEYGYFGIQLTDEKEKQKTSDEIRYILEEETLGYHRLVEKEDIVRSENHGPNINIHCIDDLAVFHRAIRDAKKGNPYGAFVHTYKPQDYKTMKLFVINAGAAGIAVKKDGDIVSVFKNPDMARADMVEKINKVLLLTAIKNGGRKLDCFDGFLPKLYCKFGFVPVCKLKFDDEFAPEGWNYERDGRPDILFFAHNGDTVEEVLRKQEDGTALDYREVEKNVSYVDDYVKAVALVDQNLNGRESTDQDQDLPAIDDLLSPEQNEIIGNTTFVVPENDGEAVMTIQIAQKLGMDVRISKQPWGASIGNGLEINPDLISYHKDRVWVFEMPDNDKEAELSSLGINIEIIDHHQYGKDDRSQEKSSLEQFLEKTQITDQQLQALGFDPHFVRGVAINDRAYIYGLREAGYNQEEIKKIRMFDLKAQLRDSFDEVQTRNQEIFSQMERQGDIFIIRTREGDSSSFAVDKIVMEKCGGDQVASVLDIRANSKGESVSIMFSGPLELVKELKESSNPSFGGSAKGDRASDFVGWINPTHDQIEQIEKVLDIST